MIARGHRKGWLRRSAYSLLELSVVLAIISLIAGAGMSMARNALKAADRIQTQEKLAAIQTALDSHAKTYGYLPCPAARNLTPTSTNFGVENRNNYTAPSQNCTSGTGGIVSISNVLIGAVPVRTLGLPDSYAADAWGNKLTYGVSANVTSEASRIASKDASITIRYGTLASPYTITTQRTAGGSPGTYSSVTSGGDASFTFAPVPAVNTIVYLKATVGSTGYNGSYWVKTGANPTKLTLDAAPASTTYLAFNAADTGGTFEWQGAGTAASYVVVSHGPDGKGAYPLAGTIPIATKPCDTTPAAGEAIDNENCDDTNATFFDTAYNDGGADAAQYFDDFIIWGSNSLQRAPVNPGLYTSGTTMACPTGVCEAWCAACTSNFPQTTLGTADTSIPPAKFDDATVGKTLCKKIITSSASTCAASCFWSGNRTAVGGAVGYYKCP